VIPLPPSARLRALAPAFVVLAIGAAFFVPRPGASTTAIPPSVSAPLPQDAFTPLPIEALRATPGFTSSGAPTVPGRRRELGAGFTTPSASARRATQDPERSAVPAALPPRGPTHVVVAGDNLWTIARNHAASLAEIVRWNAGVNPYGLVAGRRILVPGGTTMPTERSPATPRPTVRTTTTRPAAPNRVPPRTTTPSRAVGGHLWPLEVRGTITTLFSASHLGIDIEAPLGTSVRAVAAGTVIWAGWKDNGGGYVVVIRHPDGMLSTYNHNSRLLVQVGETVAAGETIARVGATGWATGPHLDFRIEMGGRWVDPLAVL
jgi:murein DD-endopeptidase MepM/ murein hydrolase activator NlpD